MSARVVVLLLVLAVLTTAAFRHRTNLKRLADQVHDVDRFVDIGVVLHTVVADPKGEELLDGKPRLRIVRTRRFGGMLDTKTTPPRLIGPSLSPRVWYCSEDQEPVVLHGDDSPLGQLVYGSEGAGKTTALAMWTYLRWLEHLGEGREGGVTAPTSTRVELVLREFFAMFSPSWYRYAVADAILTLCDGTRIRLVSTYRQSQAQGSPIQGFNWSWCARDEAQDQVDVHEDIESRGRAARDGRYKQLLTATAKDDPAWRTLRDKLDAAKLDDGSKLWIRRTLFGQRSPFVKPEFWIAKSSSMSEREYARRVLAQDLPPERATYPAWNRDLNCIPFQDLGWTDVTEAELRVYGAQRAMLAGHDPGSLWDVTLLLRAYVRNADYQLYLTGKPRKHGPLAGIPVRPFWMVRGEVNTEQSTTEHHIAKLLDVVRAPPWQLNLLTPQGRLNPNGRQIMVRADPASKREQGTDKSVYTQFVNAGIHIKPATYNAQNNGHGVVPKNAGIELVNTLFCAKSGERRLFVERKPSGEPVAPLLVRSIEGQERDLEGRAEAQKKGAADLSHWTAALRYALWAIERPRLQLLASEET